MISVVIYVSLPRVLRVIGTLGTKRRGAAGVPPRGRSRNNSAALKLLAHHISNQKSGGRAMATVSQFRARSRSRTETGREGPAFLDDLLSMAGSLASSRKEYAAAQLESLADSVRQFSEAMPAIPTMKAYADTAADSLEELANYVVESDLSDMVSDAREFTRRHPLATFGGSIAAGLVITQIVQSRAQSLRASMGPRRSRSSSRRSRPAAGPAGNGEQDDMQDDIE
jgi:hypothetical protein